MFVDLQVLFLVFSIRGRLGSIPLFLRNIGILIAYALGATVDYKYIPCICIIIPIAFVIIFSTLSNTPQYYLRKGNLHVRNDWLHEHSSNQLNHFVILESRKRIETLQRLRRKE